MDAATLDGGLPVHAVVQPGSVASATCVQLVPSHVHVSLVPMIPPKSTSFPMVGSNAMTAPLRAAGLPVQVFVQPGSVPSSSCVHVEPFQAHVSFRYGPVP